MNFAKLFIPIIFPEVIKLPLPKPEEDESKQEFMERCMSDNTMRKEFKDKDQRNAVCLVQWEESKD